MLLQIYPQTTLSMGEMSVLMSKPNPPHPLGTRLHWDCQLLAAEVRYVKQLYSAHRNPRSYQQHLKEGPISGH